MASVAVPAEHRTSGIAVLTTATALSALVASIAFPVAVEWWGNSTAIKGFAAALTVAIVVGAFLLKVGRRRYG